MKGDFTRDTFYSAHHFSRVLWQQGRVMLDADLNEQVSILLHFLRTFAKDVIGPYGGPQGSDGKCHEFEITNPILEKDTQGKDTLKSFNIGAGHYYVDGILCELDKATTYSEHAKMNGLKAEFKLPVLVYLDVWERLVTPDHWSDHPPMRERALNGADTSARAQIVWQVRCLPGTNGSDNNATFCGVEVQLDASSIHTSWSTICDKLQLPSSTCGKLTAIVSSAPNADDPCRTSPDSVYRGGENQLYRVEIHQGGDVGNATFKWSRDNGSVVFPISRIDPDNHQVYLEHLGRDNCCRLEGCWVEITDDQYELAGEDAPEIRPLYQVSSVDRETRCVTLTKMDSFSYELGKANHALLRRWDHVFKKEEPNIVCKDGAIQVKKNNTWLPLESGIQIQFSGGNYRRGDYWLIPARTATGKIEWPSDEQQPQPQHPHGVEHHYAPLALIDGGSAPTDLRKCFAQAQPCT